MQILGGLLLTGISLACLLASAVMIAEAQFGRRVGMAGLGVIFCLVCLWAVSLGIRLVLGRRGRGLLGPMALRVAAVLFGALPVVGLFTGYWQERPLVAAMQSMAYAVLALFLWRLARARGARPG